jgi:predicted nucleic acid-binding protein
VKLVLDSAYVIDHMRGLREALRRHARMFEEGDEPMVNEIVVCEVRAGTRAEHVPDVEAFLRPIEFIQPGPDHAMLAGAWRAEARARGRHLSLADALIAAAADSVGAAVLTRNVRDFELTPVRVETY